MELQLPNQPSKGNKLGKLLGFLLLFFLGLFIGRYLLPAGDFVQQQLQFVSVEEGERKLVFPTFWETWDSLHNNYIGELDDHELFYGAVAGMVRAAGDPYTVFSPPAETKQFEETIGGSFSGVGIEIGVQNGVVTVIAPLNGSPAQQAGVREGDIIVAVDDETLTQETTLDDVVRRIRGPRGETVRLTVVHRDNGNETEEIEIVRDTIEIESVRMDIEDGIAHIEITNFNGDTSQRFTEAAREADRAQVRGVILDMRGNPGGFLQAAVEISSEFLSPGQLIVSEKGGENEEYVAKGNPTLEGIPVVILVNRGSASASEIVAGALQDQLEAPVIGTQSFGKGSVQEFMKLEDGSSLRVTIAKWFTPSGRSINEEGITPDIEVQNDRENPDVDEQLNRAKEEIRNILDDNQAEA